MASDASIERTTLTQQAYQALRSAILNRRIEPGSRLVVRAWAEELGLSPTPIKSALTRLTWEGLVMYHPHRGYAVPQLDVDDVVEIYELREVVEGLAARQAAERASQPLVRDLERIIDQQRACTVDEIERYGDSDLAFHQTLWEAASNGRLLEVAATFKHQVRLMVSTSAMVPGRLSASVAEHATTLDAIRASDPEGAEAAMRTHVRRAGEALQSHLRASDHTEADDAANAERPDEISPAERKGA